MAGEDGTRTQVPETRRSGTCRILRDSLRSFCSSSVSSEPSSTIDPARGTTLKATGHGIQLGVGDGHRAPVEREPGGVARGIRPLQLAVELAHAGATGAADGLVAADVQAHEARPGRGAA